MGDRIAQTVVALQLEARTESIFHPGSYGYRPGKSAHDALASCRERCWKGNWVVDGFGIASADSGQIRPATATTSGGQKCWYVLDVQLCD